MSRLGEAAWSGRQAFDLCCIGRGNVKSHKAIEYLDLHCLNARTSGSGSLNC